MLGTETKFHPVEVDDIRLFESACEEVGFKCCQMWQALVREMDKVGCLDVCDVTIGKSSGVTSIVVVDPRGRIRGVGAVGGMRNAFNFHFLWEESHGNGCE